MLLLVIVLQNLGRLIQVSSNGSVNCPNEPAVFICSGNYVNLEIRPGIGFMSYFNSYGIFSEVNEETVVIKSVKLKLRIVYQNESFIAVKLTIPTPIPLNGSTIISNNESIQLIMTCKISNLTVRLNNHYNCIDFFYI